MTWPLRPAIPPGHYPDGEEFEKVLDQIEALSSLAWTVDTGYASTAWTASAGTPSIGNGSLTGRYRLIGKTKDFSITLVGGSSTTYGTAGAYWQFKLPGGGTAASSATGVVWGFDVGVDQHPLIWRIGATDNFMELFKYPSGRHQNNSPWTFGTSDRLEFSGTVEIA